MPQIKNSEIERILILLADSGTQAKFMKPREKAKFVLQELLKRYEIANLESKEELKTALNKNKFFVNVIGHIKKCSLS